VSLFFLTFFLIYSGVHCYAFLKIRSAFSPGPAANAFLVLFLSLMVVAPVLVRITERHGFEEPARILAYIGYCWMGFLFLFFSASLAIDIYRLLLYAAGLALHRDLSAFSPSARNIFLMAFSSALCISVYGYFEALNLRTERIVVKSSKIPAGIGRIRVVQVSDVHLGLIVRSDRLRRIVREIRVADPDILVSTGDLVDGQIDGLAMLVDALHDIKPKYGKFAVTGNHEYYAGIDQALDFTRKAGFIVLGGESAETAGITIAGVNDPTGYQIGIDKKMDEKELLSKHSTEQFTLFLKHRPVIEKKSIGLFDLQLSGHIHKGQLFPFSLVTRFFYPLGTGFTRLPDNAEIYVSRGTGTWGPPIRFMAPPEVTVIDLIRGGGDSLAGG
jgi:predicted MPP superfamily phosphohydrolase